MKYWKPFLAVYAAAAIVTFGHGAAFSERSHQQEWAECKTFREHKPDHFCNQDESAGLVAFFDAVLWPLYWSWEFWT